MGDENTYSCLEWNISLDGRQVRTHTEFVPFVSLLSIYFINQQRLAISSHQYESELSAGVLYNCWATSYATAQRILTRQLAPVCPLARAWSDLIGWSVWQALCWLCVCEGPSSNTGCLVSSLRPRTHTSTNFTITPKGSEEHLCLFVKTCAWSLIHTRKNPHITELLICAHPLYEAIQFMMCLLLCCYIITYLLVRLIATCHHRALTQCAEI